MLSFGNFQYILKNTIQQQPMTKSQSHECAEQQGTAAIAEKKEITKPNSQCKTKQKCQPGC